MPYTDRFIATDDLITHLQTFVGTITNPAIQANYAGFLSVSAVTVYELAIKDIFNDFATKKNKVFGNFVEKHFSKINGRIMISDLKGEHIKRFGETYQKKFEKKLKQREDTIFNASLISVTTVYGNLILCRHKFVHSGSPTSTINEVIDNYNNGKEIIHCLFETMKR